MFSTCLGICSINNACHRHECSTTKKIALGLDFALEIAVVAIGIITVTTSLLPISGLVAYIMIGVGSIGFFYSVTNLVITVKKSCSSTQPRFQTYPFLYNQDDTSPEILAKN